MPLMLGSFAGGLWQGAASALSLANSYQQYTMARDKNAALQSMWASDPNNPANANNPNNPNNPQAIKPVTDTSGGSPNVNATTTQPVTPGDQTAATTTPTATSPDMRERNAPVTPAAKPASKGIADGIPSSWLTSDQGIRMASAAVDAARVSVEGTTTGATNQLATPVTPTTTPAVPTVPGPGVPSAAQQSTDTGLPLPVSNAPAAPARAAPAIGGAPYSAAGVQGQPGTPSGGPAYRPGQNVISRGIDALGNILHGPSGGFTQPPASAAPATPQPVQPSGPSPGGGAAGVPGAAGGPSGAAPAAPAPITPGLTVSPAVVGQAQPAPAPTGGVGATIASALKAISPIGTAEAAEPGKGGAPAAPAAPAPAPTPPPAAAKPAAALDTSKPPPAAPTTAQPQVAGPVTDTKVRVAPAQQGPSVASAVTPPKTFPVDTSAWNRISVADQALLSRIALSKDGGNGTVTGPELATIWLREGGLRKDIGDHADPNPDDPARGMFQIHYKTQGDLDHTYSLDPHTLEGGATLAARYMAHIATDMGLDPSTPKAHLAYMAGETGARNEIANGFPNSAHIDRLVSTFQGSTPESIKQSILNSGSGNRVPAQARLSAAVQAANTGGPDGFIKSIVATGPTGIPMSQVWRNFQAAGEHYLILSGNLDGLPKFAEYVAQQSHMGAISNLYEADQALLKGDTQSAMQFIARAHAFVPDGATGEFGLDKNGDIWGTNFTDSQHNQVGQPIRITHELLAQQMVTLSNPGNYIQTRQALEKQNAEINEIKAHGQYFQEMPETRQAIAQAQAESREQIAAANRESREAIADANRQAREAKVDSGGADERNVRSAISKDYAPDSYQPQGDEPAQPSPRQAEIDTALRRSPTYGGGGLSAPMARSTAHDVLRDAKDPKKLILTPNKDGNGYSLLDKDGNVHGLLSTDMGDHIKGLAGTQALPSRAKPQAAIGAGAGSPMLAMQGGQNLGGIPSSNPPPMQPNQLPQQQQAIG